ncbi:MAG: creatininase family protein [Microbacter sp.]
MAAQLLNITSLSAVQHQKVDLVILPWGSTEPHNLHLPYGTDTILSESIAITSAEKASRKGVESVVLPAIPLGSQNPGQTDQPFCIHTRYETQKAILTDIVVSLRKQKFNKLVIVNGHGGNIFKNMIRDMLFDEPEMTIVVVDWYAIEPQEPYFEKHDDHAGEMETSVMLHFHPEWVRPLLEAGEGKETPFNIASLNQKIGWTPRHWDKATQDTGIGNPQHARAEKGEKYVEAVTDKIACLLEELAFKTIY